MNDGASLHISKTLSEVLDDIGVNERIVMNRRYMTCLEENLMSEINLEYDDSLSIFIFGSSVEGTTTLGLNPDKDVLISDNKVNVVQNMNGCKDGAINLLMVHGETPPGYCLVQCLTSDKPINPYEISGEDSNGRVFLKNTHSHHLKYEGVVQNGPALTKSAGFINQDTVLAVTSNTWPQTANNWLQKHSETGWPTEEMKRYCQGIGCFLVPVASVGSKQNKNIEWRISTALAERFLMSTLNITQIRCLVLMKTICKSYINHDETFKISSYVCKNALLHCVEHTHIDFWSEENLIRCLVYCFEMLKKCIKSENCPHFIVGENNLLAGRLSTEARSSVLTKMENLIQGSYIIEVLTTIQTDTLGNRLANKLNVRENINENCLFKPLKEIEGQIYNEYWKRRVFILSLIHWSIYDVNQSFLFKTLFRILKQIKEGNDLCQNACYLIAPFLFTTIGSAIASANISIGTSISREALIWFSFGINSDVSASKLKLASAYYCAGKVFYALCILTDIETITCSKRVLSVCGCSRSHKTLSGFFHSKSCHSDELDCVAALCVCFFAYEVHCVPKELQYELYRYKDDCMIDKEYTKHWNVDSFSFLYFLKYKILGQLKQRTDQAKALVNFIVELELYPNIGHKDTSLNLLGQCLEQEKQDIDAFSCYWESLQIAKNNDATKWHICILIARLVKKKTYASNGYGTSILQKGRGYCKDDKKDNYAKMIEVYKEIQHL